MVSLYGPRNLNYGCMVLKTSGFDKSCNTKKKGRGGAVGFRPLIIIIKGHSLRRACLQPATNTQNSKPRPPNNESKKQRKTTK